MTGRRTAVLWLVLGCQPPATPPPLPGGNTATTDAEVTTPLDQQALACLRSSSCPADEVARLFHAALDAKMESETGPVECASFGPSGIVPDPAAERVCLERVVANNDCSDGGSPSTHVLALAVRLADAEHPDLARARKLLAPCFQDAAVKLLLEHLTAKEHDPAAAPLVGCEALAATTLQQSACAAEELRTEQAWVSLLRKRVDPSMVTLFDAAATASEGYATSIGRVRYEEYAGGTLRDPAMRREIVRVLHRRRTRIAKLPALAVPTTAELSAVDRQIQVDGAAVKHRLVELKPALDATDAAFDAYRRAESALYAKFQSNIDLAVALERLEDVDALLK